MATPPARRKRTRSRRPIPSALLEGYLALLLTGSVMAIGSVHVLTLLVVSAAAGLGLLAFSHGRTNRLEAGLTILALSVASWCLLQATPLPLSWVSVLSPAHADVYRSALIPFPGEVGSASLTFDRSATLVEGLKWCLYAIMFHLGAQVVETSGVRRLCLLVFCSGVALSIATLIHGLLDAEQVFGFYAPTTRSPHWALSPLINPNNLAGYLNLATFAGLGPMLTERNRDVSRWMAVGVVVTIAQSILTGSRGGLLTLLFGLLLTYPLLKAFIGSRVDVRLPRKALRWCLATIGAAIVATWLTGPEQVWRELQNTSIEKLKLTHWTWHVIQKYPFFGVGAGAFEGSVAPFNSWGENTVFTHPENFALAWLSEFGVPAGACVALGLVFAFTSSIAGARRSVSAACALLGVAVVLLQNLFDLAFAVPGFMTAFCVLMGGLRQAARAGVGAPAPVGWKMEKSLPLVALALLSASWAITLLFGRHTVEAERRALFRDLKQLDPHSNQHASDFYQALHDAMLRHPADAYLRRLGASAALLNQPSNALPWAAASLRLAPFTAETHLILATALYQQGILHQALLELRFTAEYSSNLINEVAAAATRWTKDDRLLLRVVPPGRPGTEVLVALVRELDQGEHWKAGTPLLEQALRRSPRHPPAHALLFERLIKQVRRAQPPCDSDAAACLARAQQSLRILEAHEGNSEPNTRRRAHLLDVMGKHEEAFTLLAHRCPADSPRCLRQTISIAQKLNKPIDDLVRTYRALTCVDRDDCIETHHWLGRLYESRRENGTAVRHYTEAAQLRGSARGWLIAARQAETLGSLVHAARMIETAGRLAGSDPVLQAQIEATRKRIEANRRRDLPPIGIDLSAP